MADTTGAQAVAEAVKRVADAAVIAVASAPAGGLLQDFSFSGSLGGSFIINGSGLGASGTVKVGGVQVTTTSWSTTRIEGKLPVEAKHGEVVVEIDDKTSKRGQFK